MKFTTPEWVLDESVTRREMFNTMEDKGVPRNKLNKFYKETRLLSDQRFADVMDEIVELMKTGGE